MMDYILQRNDDIDPKTAPPVKINLAGAAIGNPWMDPFYQYGATDIAFGAGLIDLAQKETLDSQELVCQEKLKSGSKHYQKFCDKLQNKIFDEAFGGSANHVVSMYNLKGIEERKATRTFPEGYHNVERYLGGWTGKHYPSDMDVKYEDVLKALHAEESIDAGQRYEECTDPPYYALSHQDGLGVTDEIVRILEHPDEPRLLFFNGMNDLICNHVGNEKSLDNLTWKYSKDWTVAKRYAWNPSYGEPNNGNPTAGFMKEHRNLMFLKVLDSGHMVPMDLPSVALEMMQTFLSSGSFQSSKQNLDSKVPGSDGTCAVCHDCTSRPIVDSNYLQTNHDTNFHGDDSVTSQRTNFKQWYGIIGALIGASFVALISMVYPTTFRREAKDSDHVYEKIKFSLS
jgi:carboxypeptidase C (cathepsin A)